MDACLDTAKETTLTATLVINPMSCIKFQPYKLFTNLMQKAHQRKANPDNMARMLSDSHRKMQNANLSHLPTTLALSM